MKNVFLSTLTTIGIGGIAREVVAPAPKELKEEYRRLFETYGRVLLLGNGSKVLCADEGFDGGVVLTKGLDALRFDGEDVFVGAGVALPRLASECAARGLSGLEWAVGIPASIGGAVTLNAGAYGGCMADLVAEVACLGGEYSASECRFCYRGSAFDDGKRIVTGAWLKLSRGDETRIRARMAECREKRRATQPVGARTAGSAFRKVGTVGAGRYIEQAGCKGMRVGNAAISGKHANFLQNCGGATCQDAVKLLCYIKEKVKSDFGVELVQDIIEVK